jgi:hypothetical protein
MHVCGLLFRYNRINSTKFPASDTGNITEPRMMSHVMEMHRVLYTYIHVFLKSE